jgi:hypothetical protein
MSHDLWWSDELVKDVRAEVFLPSPPTSPRTELMLRFDPLEVLKSEEFITPAFISKTDKPSKHGLVCVDFNDPTSAANSASFLMQQISMRPEIRSDEATCLEIMGVHSFRRSENDPNI